MTDVPEGWHQPVPIDPFKVALEEVCRERDAAHVEILMLRQQRDTLYAAIGCARSAIAFDRLDKAENGLHQAVEIVDGLMERRLMPPRESNAIESTILLAIGRSVLDFEGIYEGYCWEYEPDDVRRAIRRLRSRGAIVPSSGKRGFYVLPKEATV